MSAHFIHGIALEIECDDSPAAGFAARSLAQDLAAFPTDRSGPADPKIVMRLRGKGEFPCATPGGPTLFRTRMARAHGFGPHRQIVYGEGSAASLDAHDESRPVVTIRSSDPDLLYEIAYGAMLSLCGELLDVSGKHRVHALGVSIAGKNAIFVANQKAGKSTLAMALKIRAPRETLFFSDETPLLTRDGILPYPHRLALNEPSVALLGGGLPTDSRPFKRRLFEEKRLFGWHAPEIAPPGALQLILVDEGVGSGPPQFTPRSRALALAALTRTMVVGHGVAQMAEYLLRFNPRQLARLTRIAGARAAVALRHARSARIYGFRRNHDPLRNAESLARFVQQLVS